MHAFFLFLITNAMVLTGAETTPSNHVLVIGMDGTRPDALRAASTPNIDALISNGAFSDTTRILGDRYRKNDTVSGPGWSSFLTGVWADKHGVNDNRFVGKNYELFPHFFARLREQFPDAQTASFVDWKPIDQHIVSAATHRTAFDAHGAKEYTKFDERIANEAAGYLTKNDPHATMVYFGSIDETGHRSGFHPSVDSYIDAIEKVDAHIGKLIAAIKARPSYDLENWLVLISTDHGGRGRGHGGGHDVPEIYTTFLIVSGASAKRGKIQQPTYVVDLPVTALVHLGVKLDSDWKLDGKVVGLAPSVDSSSTSKAKNAETKERGNPALKK